MNVTHAEAAGPASVPDSPAADGQPGLDEELRVAQSLHLVSQLPALVTSNAGGAFIVFVALYESAHRPLLAAWLALIWLLCLPMAVNWIRLRNRPPPERVSDRRIRRALWHSLVLGLAWSILTIFLLQPDVPKDVQLMLQMGLLVLALGGSIGMAQLPAVAFAFFGPIVLAVMLSVAINDETPLHAHSILNVFIAFACLFLQRQGWHSFRRTVEMAHDRASFAEAVATKDATLQATQRRMQSIAEALPYPVVVYAVGGVRVLYANQRVADLIGSPLPDVYRMTAGQFLADPADYERFLERLRADEMVTGFEAALRQRDGSELWVRLTAITMVYGGEAAVLATIEDVTERRRYETALHAAKEQAESASRAKSQFLANMSHELRTPLNAVLGYAELMADGVYGALPERARGVLARVKTNSQHLLGLINEVLDLSKIEAGHLVLNREAYSLADVVATVQSATESLARAKGLEYRIAVQADLPPGAGDVRRLTQVLLNLVGNAIKFTERGLVEIRARHAEDCFVLEVADTGPGIEKKDHARVFEEFQQVDNTSTRNKGGTGLGLAISRRIVALHGGSIELESEPGRGSVFRVTWPAEAKLQEGA